MTSLREAIADLRHMLTEAPPRTDRSGVVWHGTYGPHPGMTGPSAFSPEPLGTEPSNFPFRTDTAEAVFHVAKNVIIEYPELGPDEVLQLALEKSNFPVEDITTEDMKLLEMAIEWLQNGPPPTDIRIGGGPGGPARHTGVYGHGLWGRGAP